MSQQSTALARSAVDEACARRRGPGEAIADDAERVARACHAMAGRFHRGGKLVGFGNGGTTSDAQHVAVEFVHPVIVGKRALPGISLTSDVATLTGVANRDGFEEVFAHQLRYLGHPDDIALGVSSDGRCANVRRGLQVAKERGLLTVALLGGDGGDIAADPAVDHVLLAHTDDPRVAKEVHVTLYHLLWELVHVFFEQPGVLSPEVLR
ncbi:MAG TPA: SIS domain-containing protein [Egibacteraceae bacterium]|nr:SIS domain-containing protein [Egibacteraceae bacterium]